jgi:hypothetical protein
MAKLSDFLRDVAGGFFGNDYLRDFSHASKTFRTNLYQNAPKLKFLFHVYFDINTEAYPVSLGTGTNFGLLVKDVKLPAYNFNTLQLNQYNRKRIVQTKIKYDPVSINFHDDNGSTITKLWEAYYTYYYKDGSKPDIDLFRGVRGGAVTGGDTQYNVRTQYINSISGNDDWGYIGETRAPKADAAPTKPAFFKTINIFGFYQHKFTAYTLVNPIITSFSHDTYNYAENAGVMQNQMTVDYETVVYNYGAIDGNAPSNIVKGFGLEQNYDRKLSPISKPGSNSNVFGPNGILDSIGGFLEKAKNNQITLVDVINMSKLYYANKNLNIQQSVRTQLEQIFVQYLRGIPPSSPLGSSTRNTMFNFPIPGATPNVLGTAGAAPVGALTKAPTISKEPVAGNVTTTAPKSGTGA